MNRDTLNDNIQTQLFERVAIELRRLIRQRALPDPLPGEMSLSSRLKVSRPVLRDALQLLALEGLLFKKQGCRTRIIYEPPESFLTAPLRVLALLPRHLSSWSVQDVRAAVEKRGWAWLEVETPGGKPREQDEFLNQAWRDNEPDCLLLVGSSRVTQEWAVRRKCPAVVIGSTFPGVELPSVDVDYGALGWHAGGRLVNSGWTQIVVPIRRPFLAGDEAVVQGLRNFVEQNGNGQVTTLPIHKRDLPLQLDRLKRQFASGKSALFTFQAEDSLTALTWLLSKGFSVPNEVGLLSRESHPFLEVTYPVVTRYESDRSKLIRSVLRIVSAVAAGRWAKPVRLMPRFLRGETLSS